jgi:hypothetical protein
MKKVNINKEKKTKKRNVMKMRKYTRIVVQIIKRISSIKKKWKSR